ADLHCQFSADFGQPRVEWKYFLPDGSNWYVYYDGTVTGKYVDRVEYSTRALHFKSTIATDDGRYVCEAFDSVSKSDSAQYACQASNGIGDPKTSSPAIQMDVYDTNVGGIVAGVIVALLILAFIGVGLWFAYRKGYIGRK
ncbi:hypothetical protein scyTo_0022489, partial [Scyliorhinus torazame]|nr:hypothetical protein [Scyliorhinus torazame]